MGCIFAIQRRAAAGGQSRRMRRLFWQHWRWRSAGGRKSTDLTISRMANGVLSVNSSRAYLGKIKLQGRRTWMQYMTRNDAESIEDAPLEEYIHHLSFWVRSA